MSVPPLHQASGLFLAWIVTLCGAIVLLLGDLIPFRLPWTRPQQFFTCVVEIELFLVLFVWPLFVPGILREGVRAPQLLIYVAVLLVLALPLVLIGANVSGVGWTEGVRSQTLIAAGAAFGAGASSLRHRSALSLYFLSVFMASALFPFWAFLSEELKSPAPSFAAGLSLFWGAAEPGSAGWVQSGVTGVAGVVLLALGKRVPA